MVNLAPKFLQYFSTSPCTHQTFLFPFSLWLVSDALSSFVTVLSKVFFYCLTFLSIILFYQPKHEDTLEEKIHLLIYIYLFCLYYCFSDKLACVAQATLYSSWVFRLLACAPPSAIFTSLNIV